jgi:polyisoprenoid-binding protein YceI
MNHIRILLTVIALVASATAAPIAFDFKDPKGVNNIVFKTDAPLESINGTANGISGTVTFDPANPAATRGKILLESSSLHVGNPKMKEHLHGSMWMDVTKYPEIVFELSSLENIKTEGAVVSGEAKGRLTMKGVTREIVAPAKISYLKDKLKARVPGREGDLLVIRSNFTVKRSDYRINAAQLEDKVSNDIEISLSVAGTAPRGGNQ